MSSDVRVIVNPAAGRGRGGRMLPAIRDAFAAVGVERIDVTSASGDERALALRAIGEGCRTLVAAGGDGTWSNVANAVLASGADVRLGLIAAGTGNDFARTVGAPAADVAGTARLAVDGPDVRVDVGRIEGRHFLNIAGFGFDIAVLEDCVTLRWPHQDSLYIVSALRQLIGYGGIEIAVGSPRGARPASRHLMLIVANARHFGGAFHIAPEAELGDGKLDAIAILDDTPLGRLRLFVAAARGTHTRLPRVVTEQSPRFTLRFDAPPAYETDGEYRRASAAELEITCVPGALRVVTAAAQAVTQPAPAGVAAAAAFAAR